LSLVPPGPPIAIWGMETGFGSQRSNQNMLSSIATLAYDCRRPEFFTEQLYAALKLIDGGVLSASTRGSMHGEAGSPLRLARGQELPRHCGPSTRPRARWHGSGPRAGISHCSPALLGRCGLHSSPRSAVPVRRPLRPSAPYRLCRRRRGTQQQGQASKSTSSRF
jgi:hypothetical protein